MHKAKDICDLAYKAATGGFGPSTYRLGGDGNNAGYSYNVGTFHNGAWRSDCLGFVHIMANPDKLFYGDRNLVGGGATLNNFVNNSDEWTTLTKYCSKRGGFGKSDLLPGALLYKPGHVGLYIGEYKRNGKIYNECECYYGSNLDNGWGLRWVDLATGKKYTHKGGAYVNYWSAWGYFDHIEYTEPEFSLIRSWQEAAVKDGARLTADGEWGSYSEKAAKDYPIKRGTPNKYLCEWLQTFLQYQDLYHGDVDGVAGKYTVDAIKAYQKAHDLTVDGWCGLYMWKNILEV